MVHQSDFILAVGTRFSDRSTSIIEEFAPMATIAQIDFGFYGVMGPDEFHMMVNNNCYTNVMGKKMFDYTVDVLEEMKREAPDLYTARGGKDGTQARGAAEWKRMAGPYAHPEGREDGHLRAVRRLFRPAARGRGEFPGRRTSPSTRTGRTSGSSATT